MSKFDYDQSKLLAAGIPVDGHTSFYALIMSAMRKADGINLEKLIAGWPDVYEELNSRYNSAGGWLANEIHPYLAGFDDPDVCHVCGRNKEFGHA